MDGIGCPNICSSSTTLNRTRLCDLAGSDKMDPNHNTKSDAQQELKSINLSLTVLGKVINLLSQKVEQITNYARKTWPWYPIGNQNSRGCSKIV